MRLVHGPAKVKTTALFWTRVHVHHGRRTLPAVSRVLQRAYATSKQAVNPATENITKDPTSAIGSSLEHEALSEPTLESGPAPTTSKKKGRKPRSPKDTSIPSDASTPTSSTPRIHPGLSTHHKDLASFLAYAAKTSLSPTTKVYLGTHFEYTVAQSLTRLGFNLSRVGGVSDLGIDLIGHWTLPSRSHPLPVIIQCKAAAPRAVMMRELSGALASAPIGWRGDNAITLLVASKVATKGVRDAISRSGVPMGFLCLEAETGLVRQFVWNQAAVLKCGLEGVGVALSYPEEHVVLTWQGHPWSPPVEKPS